MSRVCWGLGVSDAIEEAGIAAQGTRAHRGTSMEPHKLYHGTLTQNIEKIREQGLVPQPGTVTTAYHEGAANFVCAADEEHKGGLTRIIIQQMANASLIKWSCDYSLDTFKCDLIENAIIVVVDASHFSRCSEISNCPKGVEEGDWYSCKPVPVEAEISGHTMLNWLPLSDTNFRYDYRKLLGRLFKAKR
jgi:hypothetical protein